MSKRRIMSLILALAMVLSIAPVHRAEAADDFTFRIIHTNDVHGRVKGDDLDDDGSVIGYELLKTFVDKEKEDYEGKVLVLDAGDTFHGTPLVTLNEGELVVDLMNKIGYDAMAPGNHDFNYGKERLLELDKKADFPILAANIETEDGKPFLEKDRIIKEVGDTKVGIFGLATEETKTKSSPKNTEGLTFKDDVAAAKEQVKALKEEGADVVIALVHLGVDDESVHTSKRLAEEVEGIDLIIDGHSHTVMEEGMEVNGTMIVQTGSYLNHIGVTDVTVDGDEVTVKPSLLSAEDFVGEGAYAGLEKDADIASKIEAVDKENEKVLGEEVGVTEVVLDGVREHVRTGETNLGNLLTDAMIDATGADVAMTNGGGIRESIPTQEEIGEDFDGATITRKHIFTAFPFDNIVATIDVTGQEILDALNHGVDAYPEVAGKFPHVAGMSYEILVKDEGNEVVNVKVGDEPLDPEKTYNLATNDFMAIGGDGYDMFAGKELKGYVGLLSEVLEEYIKKNTPINIGIEGRIKEADAEEVLPEFDRIAGEGRMETAVEISKTFGTAETAVIASARNYPDALVAGKYADKLNAPVLLVDGLTEEVKEELDRLGAKNAVIIGGFEAVTKETEKELKEAGLVVERIKGEDRYETAALVAMDIFDEAEEVVLASGEGFADALSAENISIHEDAPILLMAKNSQPNATAKAIKQLGAKKAVVVGGRETITEEALDDVKAVKITVNGEDRYETAVLAAQKVRGEMDTVLLASGEVYPDSLAAGALLNTKSAVLLLTPKADLADSVAKYMEENPFKELLVVGGRSTVSDQAGTSAYELLAE